MLKNLLKTKYDSYYINLSYFIVIETIKSPVLLFVDILQIPSGKDWNNNFLIHTSYILQNHKN